MLGIRCEARRGILATEEYDARLNEGPKSDPQARGLTMFFLNDPRVLEAKRCLGKVTLDSCKA